MPLQVLGFEKQTAYDLFWPLAWQTYGIQMEQDCFFSVVYIQTHLQKQQAKPGVENWPKEERVQFCSMAGLKQKLLPTERLSSKALTFPNS